MLKFLKTNQKYFKKTTWTIINTKLTPYLDGELYLSLSLSLFNDNVSLYFVIVQVLD